MGPFIAEFVGTSPLAEPIIAISHTANLAIQDLLEELRERIRDNEVQQVEQIIDTKKVPDRLRQDDFERDARAILNGSNDLRPYIAIRRLPPSAG